MTLNYKMTLNCYLINDSQVDKESKYIPFYLPTFVYTNSVFCIKNCKFTRMIINFRYTYVRQAHLHSQGNQRLGYKHPGTQRGCFVQTDLYGNPPTSYHLHFQGSNGAVAAFQSWSSAFQSSLILLLEERKVQPYDPIIDRQAKLEFQQCHFSSYVRRRAQSYISKSNLLTQSPSSKLIEFGIFC
ncbi:Hypothetical_protein [Hexamita inflata]|uniref:Hypothetical_protein n=1 Tax=Hexamita inflata TaxID=28002 RepID=A0AA86PW61_9EUKA|nr:Hypothetical protein HINF_LOCUS29842 [Hexamita inflata]